MDQYLRQVAESVDGERGLKLANFLSCKDNHASKGDLWRDPVEIERKCQQRLSGYEYYDTLVTNHLMSLHYFNNGEKLMAFQCQVGRCM